MRFRQSRAQRWASQAVRTQVPVLEVPKSGCGARRPSIQALIDVVGVRDFGEIHAQRLQRIKGAKRAFRSAAPERRATQKRATLSSGPQSGIG